MEYRVATLDDIDLLTASRVKVLRAANKLDDSVDMTDMLVNVSKERGVKQISLEATDMGRPLYEKYGFVKMESEMELIMMEK